MPVVQLALNHDRPVYGGVGPRSSAFKNIIQKFIFLFRDTSPVVEADLVFPRRRRFVLDGLAEGHGAVQQDLQIGILSYGQPKK